MCKGCEFMQSGSRCHGCGACPNEIKNMNVQIAPGFVIQQKGEVASKEKCKDTTFELVVEVAPGTADGDVLTFARQSEQRPGMIPGDIKLKVQVDRDADFRRSGSDLHVELPVSLKQALLGFNASIRHLDGHVVHLSRNAVTKPHQVFTVRGEGMPIRTDGDDGDDRSSGAAGDLHAKVIVQFPDTLEREAYEWAQRALPG